MEGRKGGNMEGGNKRRKERNEENKNRKERKNREYKEERMEGWKEAGYDGSGEEEGGKEGQKGLNRMPGRKEEENEKKG